MKITFSDHDGKGLRFADALAAAGHEVVDEGGDVLLIDADVPLSPYIERCDAHDKVVLYPHGGGIVAHGDGQWPIHPHTVGNVVIGTGQADVLAACDYPLPVEVVGWPFCDRLPVRQTEPNRVLLAPQHPMSDGWLPAGARESNARIHDELVALGVDLTVRWVPLGQFGLEHIGITPHPAVTYSEAVFEVGDGVAAVDAADVVVAESGTFPNIAIARGCPTVMYGQVEPCDHQNGSDAVLAPRSWHRYRETSHFPLDADEDALADLLERACNGDAAASEWADRFVGPQMDPARFVEAFEKLVA